jgi:hypothetical protein
VVKTQLAQLEPLLELIKISSRLNQYFESAKMLAFLALEFVQMLSIHFSESFLKLTKLNKFHKL